jgi:hypothetical protein
MLFLIQSDHILERNMLVFIYSLMFFNSISFQLLRSDRQNGYEIQTEADILLERQRKEIQMTKNNQRGKLVRY